MREDLDENMSRGKTEEMELRRSYAEEIKKSFKQAGLDGVTQLLTENMDRWCDVTMDIAVTGNSGSGKSTFINAILGLTADDDDAAQVGEIETTMRATPYVHPRRPRLRFWDLPGVGTERFPRDSYNKDVNFYSYDVFLILSNDRLTENDIWVAKEIRKAHKPFLYVRTKIDNAVDNDKRAHPRTHEKDALLARILQDCEKQFADAGFADVQFYLISSHRKTTYDFNRIETRLDDLCAEVMLILSTSAFIDIVNENVTALQERVKQTSYLSGAYGMLSGATLSVYIDKQIITNEVHFIRKQFGMEDDVLTQMATQSKVSLRQVKQHIRRTNRKPHNIEAEIAEFVGNVATEKSWIAIVPVLGMYSNATQSAASTESFLREKISEIGNDMINVYVYLLKCLINDCYLHQSTAH